MNPETEQQRYERIAREGYRACKRAVSNIDCPYDDPADQEAWNEGWFERIDDEQEAEERGDY